MAKVTQEAKDIVVVFKRVEKASEQLHKGWSTTTKPNEELASRLQEADTKLKQAEERLQGYESERSVVPDATMENKIAEQEANIQRATKRQKRPKLNNKKLPNDYK